MFRCIVTKAALIAFACTASLAANAYAIDRKPIEIPAGELAAALRTLATQAGVEFFYQTDLVRGLRTGGVTGVLSAEEAVQRLLQGTPLTLQVDSSGAMLIVAPRASAAAAAPAALRISRAEGAQVAPSSGTGLQGEERKPYWKRFRLAQNTEAQSSEKSDSLADESESSGSAKLQEIVVTAQKREQRLIEVPMAITAITGDELQARGIDTLEDMAFAVPGMTLREDGPGSYQVFLRGAVNQYAGFSGPMVSIYQDEYTLNLNGYDVLPTRIMDMNRVEVLKGPQGTLYGLGAVGGTVRYITNDPVIGKFDGNLDAEMFNVASGAFGGGVTGVVNVPLGETFAVRVAANYQDGGGWQDQPQANIKDGNGTELTNIRLKALWQASEEFATVLTYINYRADTQLGQGYEEPDRTIFVGGGDRGRVLDPKIFDYELYNLKATLDLGFAELLSSTTHADLDHQYGFTWRTGPPTLFPPDSGYGARNVLGNLFTQELRLSSTGESRFGWTIGGYYADAERDYSEIYGGETYSDLHYTATNGSKSYAFFGDASYKLTDMLEAGAGIRYFRDKQMSQVLSDPDQSSRFSSVDPRFYLSYALNDDMSLYSSVGKGFRSGGHNGFDFLLGFENPDYKPEKIWSYEIGYKGRLLDGALYLDTAAFYMDYSDMIRRGLVPVAGFGLRSINDNIGKAKMSGVELGLSWKATGDLTLDGNVSLLDGEITGVDSAAATSAEGDPIDYLAPVSFTLGARYDFTWGSGRPGFIRLNYSYRDKMAYVDRSSFPAENVPQYSDDVGLLDARLGFTVESVDFELFGTNLTNENKWLDPYHGWGNADRTRPRVLGVRARVAF